MFLPLSLPLLVLFANNKTNQSLQRSSKKKKTAFVKAVFFFSNQPPGRGGGGSLIGHHAVPGLTGQLGDSTIGPLGEISDVVVAAPP